MNKLLTTLLLIITTTTFLTAQTITDTVSTGASYTNQVWYSLKNDEQGSAPKDNWDIAFEVAGGFGASILANTQKALTVYQAPYAVAQWGGFDTTGYAAWPQLNNSDTNWQYGALNTHPDDNFDLGWGVYDMNTHYINGDSTYLVKLANGTLQKLKIDRLKSGKYFFTYADVDGGNEKTDSLVKANYTGKNFAYYSLQNSAALDREPVDTAWDITFTKYITTLYTPAPMPYGVTGVLLNRGIKAVKATGVEVATATDQGLPYETAINTIGYNWKTFNSTTFAYDIEDSMVYFVQLKNNDVWKVQFTGFGGSATGNYIFTKTYQQPSLQTGIAENDAFSLLSAYPNPTQNTLHLVYNNTQATGRTTPLNIYDLNGRQVLTETIATTTGLNQQQVNVSSLMPGIYLASILGKNFKLVIQ